MYQLLGLNLMSLLAQNRLGEFHTVSSPSLLCMYIFAIAHTVHTVSQCCTFMVLCMAQ